MYQLMQIKQSTKINLFSKIEASGLPFGQPIPKRGLCFRIVLFQLQPCRGQRPWKLWGKYGFLKNNFEEKTPGLLFFQPTTKRGLYFYNSSHGQKPWNLEGKYGFLKTLIREKILIFYRNFYFGRKASREGQNPGRKAWKEGTKEE